MRPGSTLQHITANVNALTEAGNRPGVSASIASAAVCQLPIRSWPWPVLGRGPALAEPPTVPASDATEKRPAARPITKSPALPARATVAGAVAKRELDELVKQAQRGDAVAFAELFRTHRSSVAAIAYRMLGPSADLEDVVQEVFLQVHRSLPDFRGQAKFSTWLHRVAVNVVLMTRRRARSRPSYAKEEAGRHEPDDRPLPDHDVARSRRLAAFRKLLDRLSEKKRTVFVLHELEGMAPAKIAEVVDCPVLTVRTRLFYARRELAQMMRAEPTLMAIMVGDGPNTTSQDEPDEGRRQAAKNSQKASSRDDTGEVSRPASVKEARTKKGGKS